MFAVTGLFLVIVACKVLWNLAVPYALAPAGRPEGRGISLMLGVEWVALGLAALSAGVSDGARWIEDAAIVGLVGAAVILASYLHFVIAGMVLGRRRARRGPSA